MSHQLSLNLRLKDGSSFNNFFIGPNSEALQRLRTAVVAATRDKASDQMMFLWGADGSGKTHLLQAACRLAQWAGCSWHQTKAACGQRRHWSAVNCQRVLRPWTARWVWLWRVSCRTGADWHASHTGHPDLGAVIK